MSDGEKARRVTYAVVGSLALAALTVAAASIGTHKQPSVIELTTGVGAATQTTPAFLARQNGTLISTEDLNLEKLSLSAVEAAGVLSGSDLTPVEQRPMTEVYSTDHPEPSAAAIESAFEAFAAILDAAGYRGQVHLEPGVFMLYEGTAPHLATEVVVVSAPVTAGGHENYARQSAALNADAANTDSQLGEQERGVVMLGDSVAYGRGAGSSPQEWVALQMSNELIIISIDHQTANTVLGQQKMLDQATAVAADLISLGFTTDRTEFDVSQASQYSEADASVLWTLLSTRCPPGASRSVCTRPILGSSPRSR